MARNCHFLNNFAPVVTLAMLSSMDFQATLTKDAVIDYMTKYMTKSGQGALIKVMEHSSASASGAASATQAAVGAASGRQWAPSSASATGAAASTGAAAGSFQKID